MIEFYLPTSGGEWAAFAAAAITALTGLAALVAPRAILASLGLAPVADRPGAIAEGRSRLAGFPLAIGLCALLFAQPLVYLALGAGWAFSAIGRLVSVIVDRGNPGFNLTSAAVEIVLAAGPLLYGLGMI